MKTIEEIQQEIIQEFEMYDQWLDKYEYLIEIGKTLPQMDNSLKTNENLITGCQSNVWLHSYTKENKIFYLADSDAIITKGIIALLIRVFSNQESSSIIRSKDDFINQIGLKEQLSPTRANGLLSMLKKIKLYALAFTSKK